MKNFVRKKKKNSFCIDLEPHDQAYRINSYDTNAKQKKYGNNRSSEDQVVF